MKKKLAIAIALVALVAVGVMSCDFIEIYYPGSSSNDIAITLKWDTDNDLDSYVTYPNDLEGTGADANLPGSFMANPDSTYYPSSITKISYTSKGTNSSFAQLLYDSTSGKAGREVMVLHMGTIGDGTGSSVTIPASLTGASADIQSLGSVLPHATSTTYNWLGFATYYVYGTDSNISSADGSTVDATVTVTQGTTKLGVLTLPTNMNLKAASVLKVHVFNTATTNYLVFYPDVRNVGGISGIKSFDGSATPLVVSFPRNK
jgi:hypothetical protein